MKKSENSEGIRGVSWKLEEFWQSSGSSGKCEEVQGTPRIFSENLFAEIRESQKKHGESFGILKNSEKFYKEKLQVSQKNFDKVS